MLKRFAMIATFAALSGCGGASTDPQNSFAAPGASFATPDSDGLFPNDLIFFDGSPVRAFNGNGFSYQVGATTDGIVARAGLIPNARVASAPDDTTVVIPSIITARSADAATPDASSLSVALIDLTADFSAGTLTGAATTNAQNGDTTSFAVSGRMSDGLLSGDVTFDGIDGSLAGLIGADEVLGAFQGVDGDRVMAGGITRQRPN
ncbi:hypothetical protein [Yoonia sp. 208BN28-4]|uniref:hypothetical protein n=1 Tax=Yoonia sp. 208BN28-4 TaxID=3126505 RepID=UPI00309D0B27